MKVHAGQPIGAQLIAGQFPYAAFDTWVQSGSASRTEVTKTVYDAADPSVNIPGFTQKNLRNRVASTYIYPKALSAGYVAATLYSYDIHGNVKTLIQENRNTGLSQTYKRVDYDYDLVSGNVNTVKYQDGKPDAFYHYYEYDADNRITNVYTSSTPSFTPDSRTTAFSDQEAKYFYYDHGPLARVETGENKVQASDYVYTIQGWIKNVNSNTLNTTRDIGKDGQASNVNLNNDFVARDAYGYSLNYFFNDYKSISGAQTFIASLTANANVPQNNTAGSGSFAKNLYNGNINSMVTAMVDAADLTTNTPSPQLTAYKYDQLNRITGMNAYRTPNITTTNAWDDGSTYNQNYETRISYDKNGNILGMLCNGIASQNLAMDSLSYKYENIANGYTKNTNKLRYVKDNANSNNYTTDIDDQTANNYIYDEIGNLTHDEQEEIESIEWTVYGKVKKVTRKSGSEKPDLEFGYDASGNRIMKIVKQRNGGPSNQEGWIYTYYVHDASGNIMATYKKEYAVSAGNQFNESLSLLEHNIFGSSRLGIDTKQITLANAGFTNTGGNYNTDGTFASVTGYTLNTTPAEPYITHAVGYKQYELSNHLGNVLTTVSDRRKAIDDRTSSDGSGNAVGSADGVVDYFTSNVTSVSDYYAFGMQMPGRNHNSSDYKYGFNGKTKDDELKTNGNSYDFGARMYDPRLGRWTAVDPLRAKYPSMSSYSFAGNSPLYFIDPNGKDLFATTEKARERVSTSLIQAFGKSEAFSFNENNKLIFDQTKVDFDKLSDAQQIMLGEFVTNVVNNTKIEANIVVAKSSTGGETDLPDKNFNEIKDGEKIKVDIYLEEKPRKDLLNLDISKEDKDGANTILSKEEKSGISQKYSGAIIFWHEIGHLNRYVRGNAKFTKENDQKTVGFENLFRSIIRFPLRLGNRHSRELEGGTRENPGADNKLLNSIKKDETIPKPSKGKSPL